MGELWMRATIAASVVAYAAAEYLWYTRRFESFRLRRAIWTSAAALCVTHSALAIAVRHGWSHDAALLHTAVQTAAVTGLRWGGGLFVNYVFLALWTADVAWLWGSPASYARRPERLNTALSAFFIFMFLNGAVIFAGGASRVLGTAAVVTVAAAWWRRDRTTAAGVVDKICR